MGRTIARLALVFAVWAIVLIGAILAGLKPEPSELAAGVGTGTSLIAWGILLHRARRAASRDVPLEPAAPRRERATV